MSMSICKKNQKLFDFQANHVSKITRKKLNITTACQHIVVQKIIENERLISPLEKTTNNFRTGIDHRSVWMHKIT